MQSWWKSVRSLLRIPRHEDFALRSIEPFQRPPYPQCSIRVREYEQLSYSEIAQLLRIPVNTVRSRLFRARLALKIWLEPEKRVHGSETPIDAPARPREGKV
jgi:hypothetical protein